MTTPTETDKAWLAGLYDGEGSIGVTRYQRPGRTNLSVTIQVQMSMTHEPTIRHALELAQALGCRGTAYTYQERNPDKHKPCWRTRINRLADVAVLADALLPYAVTKRDQWYLAHQLATSRLAKVPATPSDGRSHRGGLNRTPYDTHELDLIEQLATINRRGPITQEHQ